MLGKLARLAADKIEEATLPSFSLFLFFASWELKSYQSGESNGLPLLFPLFVHFLDTLHFTGVRRAPVHHCTLALQ